jgi:hypothetical protein
MNNTSLEPHVGPVDGQQLAAHFVNDAPLPPRLQWAKLALPAMRSVKRNWRAMAALQVAGLAVVLAYYGSADVRAACDRLAQLKQRGGLPAAAVVMAFCCAVLPELAKYAFNVDRVVDRQRIRTIGFNGFLYAVLGVIVDWFYMLQSHLFGSAVDAPTVMKKITLDQFIFSPFLSLILIALAYTLRQYRYSFTRTLAALGPHWYVTRVIILLLPCWAFWIPMTSLMYALPPSLTFVFGAMASGASSIVLNAVAGESSQRRTAVETV